MLKLLSYQKQFLSFIGVHTGIKMASQLLQSIDVESDSRCDIGIRKHAKDVAMTLFVYSRIFLPSVTKKYTIRTTF
jgi:hypothetical protein